MVNNDARPTQINKLTVSEGDNVEYLGFRIIGVSTFTTVFISLF